MDKQAILVCLYCVCHVYMTYTIHYTKPVCKIRTVEVSGCFSCSSGGSAKVSLEHKQLSYVLLHFLPCEYWVPYIHLTRFWISHTIISFSFGIGLGVQTAMIMTIHPHQLKMQQHSFCRSRDVKHYSKWSKGHFYRLLKLYNAFLVTYFGLYL